MKLLIVALIFLALSISIKLATMLVDQSGFGKSVSIYRMKYIKKTIHIALLFLYAAILIVYLSIDYSQVLIFISSIFAVLGVALFAQWSILSNITASLIIFFGFPYRVGDFITVVDKDADISGVIEEISLFHVLIKKDELLISYPNILILQKPVIQNVRTEQEAPPTDAS
ncbi:MAG: mechanosensitive ion channel [Methylophilaceae bacterium]|nr:mechanosensitive ion channel [Methylophilaceae bacterium]MDG1821684.1 mechanosensitive ion channel [Methylophilaceae bacterium]MDG2293949.1 mechanosensitive ion channel [Methylophilaceae bacterium]